MAERNTVVITDLRSDEAQDAFSFLKAQGYQVVSVPEDIRLWDEEALKAFAEPLKDTLLGVIHPAPPMILGGVEEVTEEDWAKAADEGPLAAMIVTKVFCNIMRENRQGSIIYLNNMHAERPVGKGFLFSIGCGAVEMLAKEIPQDYGTVGVRSYFVMRGKTEKDLIAKSDTSTEYFGVDLKYPLRKFPERGHLNGLLAFLLTDAAAPLTGAPLEADDSLQGYYGHREKMEGVAYER